MVKSELRRIGVYVFLILGLLGVFGNAPNFAAAQDGANFELGGQILTFADPGLMHTATMSWMKMQLTWRRGDSTTGAQMIINHARTHGFKVLLSIKGIKSELAANPTQYYRDFAEFLGDVAALNPEAIEVWNEPNIDQEWPAGQISGTRYTDMLRQAYPAIKQANQNVMVISGAPAPTGFFGGKCANGGCDDKIFIEQMKAAGAASYFDCTGIHYNEGILPPTATSGDPRGNSSHYTRYYPTMVSTYRAVFSTKPLCFTELGYLSPDGLGQLPSGFEWAKNTSAEEQADWLAQAALLSRDGGVVRMMIVWNVNATFVSTNPMAGYAIIRQNNQCLACATLAQALSEGPDAPALVLPTNGALVNTTTPRFEWNSVQNAESYRIEIDNNANFSSPERTNSRTNTAYTTNPGLPDGTWYWRVRGRNSEGDGPWSLTRHVIIDTLPTEAPLLVSPLDGSSSTVDRPTFRWTAVDDAVGYEFRIGLVNPPSAPAVQVGGITYRPVTRLYSAVYYWQVRAIDTAGNASEWSLPFSFTVLSAQNAIPILNYYSDSTITLRWTGLTWAAGYQIQIDTASNFAKPLTYEATVPAGTLEIVTPELANGVYYWRVRAQRTNGSWGSWSAVTGFQIAAPK